MSTSRRSRLSEHDQTQAFLRWLLFGFARVLRAVAGFAIAYNIRHYEPIEGEGGRPDRLETVAEWSLLGASMVNIAYYTMILVALVQLPFGWDSVNGRGDAVWENRVE